MTVAILLLTYSTVNSSARRIAEEQARQHVEALLSYFSGVLAEAVAAGDRMQVHLLARALLDNGAQALSVTDKQGKIIFVSTFPGEMEPTGTPDISEPFEFGILETTVIQGKSYLHAASPIRFGKAPVGMLQLWLNRDDLEERMQQAYSSIYIIFTVGFLLLLILGGVVFRTTFRALRRLTTAAEKIGAGDLSSRVPVSGRDEIAAFCTVFNRMVDSLSTAREELAARHLQTISAMIGAMEAKDNYTQGHCARVRKYAARILEKFPGVSPEDKHRIETAALLHDIGKIGMPDDVLLKAHRLSREESARAQEHVLTGERILNQVDSMKELARWVRHHHERWDGGGYPDGLEGAAIPFASRIIAVADCIDAMLTDRPYRKALTRAKLARVLQEGRGVQFDPEVVDVTLEILPEMDSEQALEEEPVAGYA